MDRRRIVVLLLALITLLLYMPVQRHGFLVFDDPDYVTENPVVQNGLTWAGIKWAFTTFHASNWHPLTWISHMLDCQVFGLNSGAQHLVNVLFHVANTVTLFLLLFRWSRGLWRSAMVAAVFAWHPMHVESVAWISERKDVLSTFLGLLALVAYTRFAQEENRSPQPGAASRRMGLPSTVSYWAAWFWFGLSLLAKPMLVTLPFLMLLLDYWPLERRTPLRARVLEKWPFLLLTVGSCVVTFLAQRAEAVVALDRVPLALRIGNALLSFVRYAAGTLFPHKLAILYPLPEQVPFGPTIAAAVTLGALSFSACYWRRSRPYLFTGWFWFLGTLVPVIGIVQVGGQSMADRYNYFPMIGLLIGMTWAAVDLAARSQARTRITAMVSVAALVAFAGLTVHQLTFWTDSKTLFAHAIAVTSDNDIAQINLGVALEQEGRVDEALRSYREALRINPRRAQVHNNLANLLASAGHRDEAYEHYVEALRLNPNAPLARLNFGTLLIEMGKFDEGLEQYHLAARAMPMDARPFYLMGKALLRQGRTQDAIGCFRAALQRKPDHFQSLIFLAQVLASDEDARCRNGAEAVKLAERANNLTGGREPMVLDVLAMAYAESGRFREAETVVGQAIELARTFGAEQVVAKLQSHAALYRADKPYREKSGDYGLRPETMRTPRQSPLGARP